MAEFDTSSDEDDLENVPPVEPLRLDWVNIPHLGLCGSLALSALPGCRFRDVRRNLNQDLDHISEQGITDVFTLMVPGELVKYRVPNLVQELEKRGIFVHLHPVEDGGLPPVDLMMQLVHRITGLLSEPGNRVLVHCYGGLGRTCLLAACLLLSLDPSMRPDSAISYLRALRGARAVQTVRQWNFIQEFPRLEKEFREKEELYEDRSRSVSR